MRHSDSLLASCSNQTQRYFTGLHYFAGPPTDGDTTNDILLQYHVLNHMPSPTTEQGVNDSVSRQLLYHFTHIRQLVPLSLLHQLSGRGPASKRRHCVSTLCLALKANVQALQQFRAAAWHSARVHHLVSAYPNQRPYESNLSL